MPAVPVGSSLRRRGRGRWWSWEGRWRRDRGSTDRASAEDFPLRGERTAGGAYVPRASARCARTPRGSRVMCPARVLAGYGQRGETAPPPPPVPSPPRAAIGFFLLFTPRLAY